MQDFYAWALIRQNYLGIYNKKKQTEKLTNKQTEVLRNQ